jgi:hypothetical protein
VDRFGRGDRVAPGELLHPSEALLGHRQLGRGLGGFGDAEAAGRVGRSGPQLGELLQVGLPPGVQVLNALLLGVGLRHPLLRSTQRAGGVRAVEPDPVAVRSVDQFDGPGGALVGSRGGRCALEVVLEGLGVLDHPQDLRLAHTRHREERAAVEAEPS